MNYFSCSLPKSLGLICASLLSLPALAPPVWAGSLEYWKFDLRDSRLDIITDEDVRPQVNVLRNPTRVVVDLPGIEHRGPTIYKPLTSMLKKQGLVDGIIIRLALSWN